MSERQFRLGICQLMSGVDKEENMKKAEAMVREAAAGGARRVRNQNLVHAPFLKAG